MLSGRKILLGITGGIAAYKAAELTRLLVKQGAEVQAVLTREAQEFVTPLTLSTLSGKPALLDFVSRDKGAVSWNNHVDLGIWADLMLIAPATANTLAKMARGHCDNLLLACYLSAKCPVFFAPAMDLDMFAHPSTTANIQVLQTYGNTYIPVGEGELASGLIGQGRMAEPQEILELIRSHFREKSRLNGRKVLISAGPTWEAIDKVRFIGNRSTGTMGFELARFACELGADVELICGPVGRRWPEIHGLKTTYVESALEMKEELFRRFDACDFFISAAAVADYRPTEYFDGKLKKKDGPLQLKLERTDDILHALGQRKRTQKIIGFALEADEGEEAARHKLKSKNLDAIVLNSLSDKGAGFGDATNKVSWLDTNHPIKSFELKSKKDVAKDIWGEILQL